MKKETKIAEKEDALDLDVEVIPNDEIPVENESKDSRFKRIAERRISKILHDIKLIGNLANKSLYAYSVEQVNKMFLALEESIEMSKSKFNYSLVSKEVSKFSL